MDGSSKLRRWRCVAIGQEGVWRGWWSKPFGHDVRHPQIEALPSNRYDSRGASTNRSTTLRRSGNSSGNFELIAPTLPPLGRATHANRLPTPPFFRIFALAAQHISQFQKHHFCGECFFFLAMAPLATSRLGPPLRATCRLSVLSLLSICLSAYLPVKF